MTVSAVDSEGYLQLHIIHEKRAKNGKTKPLLHVWTVDPAHSYRLVRYEVRSDDFSEIDIQNRDFVSVDGIQLPKAIWLRCFHKTIDGAPHLRFQSVIKVSEYKINDPEISEESIRIVWPEGTNIFDTESGANLQVAPPAHSLTDDALNNARAKWKKFRSENKFPE